MKDFFKGTMQLVAALAILFVMVALACGIMTAVIIPLWNLFFALWPLWAGGFILMLTCAWWSDRQTDKRAARAAGERRKQHEAHGASHT